MQAMFAFLKKNINYSSTAIEEKIQGDVIIDFTVTPKGVVANSRITKGLHPDIDKEVLGTLKKDVYKRQTLRTWKHRMRLCLLH